MIFENNINVLNWCPRSPDLNPIEHIWSWIDSKMVKLKIGSQDQLKQILQELWMSIQRELCMKLIESMPKRVKACYKAKGGYFKH